MKLTRKTIALTCAFVAGSFALGLGGTAEASTAESSNAINCITVKHSAGGRRTLMNNCSKPVTLAACLNTPKIKALNCGRGSTPGLRKYTMFFPVAPGEGQVFLPTGMLKYDACYGAKASSNPGKMIQSSSGGLKCNS